MDESISVGAVDVFSEALRVTTYVFSALPVLETPYHLAGLSFFKWLTLFIRLIFIIYSLVFKVVFRHAIL